MNDSNGDTPRIFQGLMAQVEELQAMIRTLERERDEARRELEAIKARSAPDGRCDCGIPRCAGLDRCTACGRGFE